MEIITLTTGAFATNSYILVKNNDVVLIDPSGNYENIVKRLNNYNVLAIILTHGHFDHIKAVDKLKDIYKVDIYIHQDDEILIRNKEINNLMGHFALIESEVKYLKEGILTFNDFSFEVIHTPGHTKGSVVFLIDNYMFAGDTIFKGSIGRTDLYGGSFREMKNSLNFLKTLTKNYIIYSGHGPVTTLQEEIEHNPYLK